MRQTAIKFASATITLYITPSVLNSKAYIFLYTLYILGNFLIINGFFEGLLTNPEMYRSLEAVGLVLAATPAR